MQGQLANRLREFSQALAAFHRDVGRVFPAHSSEPSRFPGVLRT